MRPPGPRAPARTREGTPRPGTAQGRPDALRRRRQRDAARHLLDGPQELPARPLVRRVPQHGREAREEAHAAGGAAPAAATNRALDDAPDEGAEAEDAEDEGRGH